MTNYKSDAEYYANDIAEKLVGGRITRALLTETDEFGITFFGFRVTNGSKQFDVWVQRDPEGNGEGFLAIEPALPQFDG
jgi:hypothetical protein